MSKTAENIHFDVWAGDAASADVKELTNEQLGERIDGLEGKAQEILGKLGSNPTQDDINEVKSQLESTKETLGLLSTERDERLRAAEIDAVKAQIQPLEDAIKTLQGEKSAMDVILAGGQDREGASGQKSIYTPDAKAVMGLPGASSESFFNDLLHANRGRDANLERMLEDWKALGVDEAAVKAMTEGTDSAGGYLVTPTLLDEIITTRERAGVIRNLCSKLQVTSDSIQINSISGNLTAAWVAELAEKPTADLTLGQITASVFTAAGLAIVSNQLLADARPSIDSFIVTELAKRISALEELAFIAGTGSGQPRGILNTSGIGTTTYTDASPTVPEALVQVAKAIAAVQEDFLEDPDGIVMRPSTWTKIITDADSAGKFTLGFPGGSVAGRTAADAFPARTLFGIPVYLSGAVPNNLGAGTNETRIIVGRFREALILDRQGFTVDESKHVYFTSNQHVFRGESRVGFTAARYPKAFNVIGGTGLIGF